MTVGDGFSGLGATRYRWVPAVAANVQLVLSREPALTANTYVCHPWCGWGRYSVDFWGSGGRGDPAPLAACQRARDLLFHLNRGPAIRHYILGHTLWTSFGGFSRWERDDHSGNLRHLHVTYWR